jgi:hypothetical protein
MSKSVSTFLSSILSFVRFQVILREHARSQGHYCSAPCCRYKRSPTNVKPRIIQGVPMNLFAKKNRYPIQYWHDWQDPIPRPRVQLPVKSPPQHFPHIWSYGRGRQHININNCRGAQGHTPSFHFTIPRVFLATQAVERGSGQEPTITHMGCSIGVERYYSAWFPLLQSAGWCSGCLWPEWGQRGVDMGCRLWAVGRVWMACPLQTRSHQRGPVGGLGSAGVREEGTAWGGQPSSAHFPLWVVEG